MLKRAHQPRARQILLRHDADTLFLDLVGDRNSVARRCGVAGVEDDLAFERGTVVLADLRQGAIGHCYEEHVAKGDRLIDSAGLGELAEIRTPGP